jgi:hypothetical protein
MGTRVGTALLAITLTGAAARAESTLTDLAYFTRCYTQFTGHRPALSNPLRAQVKAGTKTGYDACVALLDKARFGAGHRLTNTADPEAIDVLNHLNDFHRSWFPQDNLEGSITDTNGALRYDKQIHDETEPALHVTRALFEPNVPYSDVVTQGVAVEALRSSGTLTQKTWDGTSGWANVQNLYVNSYDKPVPNKFLKQATTDPNSQALLNPELVQTGNLWGVRPMSENTNKSSLVSYSKHTAPTSAKPGCCYRDFPYPIKIHEPLGGAGVAGLKSYLIMNLGRPGNTYADGGLEMPRRWAKAVVNDLLCRELPAIRLADAAIYVQGNSKLPFRNGQQCMQCHATIDPLGALARNVSIRPATGFDHSTWGNSVQLAVHPVLLKQVGTTDVDEEYYKRPPDGHLLYRSYTGEKVFIPLTGNASAKDAFDKLGTALAGTDDLYVCAASRYYQKLTGIKVNLQDPGDKASLTLNLYDLRVRNEVIGLGKSFKAHKDTRRLILDILKTDTYRKASPGGLQQ